MWNYVRKTDQNQASNWNVFRSFCWRYFHLKHSLYILYLFFIYPPELVFQRGDKTVQDVTSSQSGPYSAFTRTSQFILPFTVNNT